MAEDRERSPVVEDLVCFALAAAARAAEASYRPELSRFDLTYSQYLVMLVLWEGDGVSLGRIGDRLHLDSGTITPLLKRLEKRGYIARRRDPTDERVVRITLTDEGRAIERPVADAVRGLVCRLDLDAAEVAALRDGINGLRHALARVAHLRRRRPADDMPPARRSSRDVGARGVATAG